MQMQTIEHTNVDTTILDSKFICMHYMIKANTLYDKSKYNFLKLDLINDMQLPSVEQERTSLGNN